MLLIGPPLLSGIGQHLKKYEKVIPNSVYVQFSDNLPDDEEALIFALPVKQWLDKIPSIKSKYKKLTCMTVCETETVHEDYGKLFSHFSKIAVPSEFCRKVFSRQFPETTFFVIHAHVPTEDRYVFYHIGNILDQRKNFNDILEAFIKLNEPNAYFLIKATCHSSLSVNLPNVKVINGLVTENDMDDIHRMGDCYVNFSSSEGVGLGAVEAAMRDKPVIVTSYGGATEYVKTPYTIDCTTQCIDKDDFLFKKGMHWGKPNPEQLLEYMRDAFDKRLKYMDHSHTKNLIGKDAILKEFLLNDVIGEKSGETRENSA